MFSQQQDNMEVTALCSRLLMTVLLPLVTQVDFSYSQNAAFPQVFPDRQQHFKYESIVVSCEGLDGLTGWRVMRKIQEVVKTCAPSWSTSTGPCEIKNLYPATDSGEYWCEMGRKRSNSVNIAVAAGSVILESPVHAVMEGDTVTLRCEHKQTSFNLTADFFKDGHIMDSSSTESMTIHSVSKSNEGLYKCRISGAGESPESWLTVRAALEEPHPSSHDTSQLPLLLGIGLSVPALLLLLVGLLQWRKHQAVNRGSTTSPPTIHSQSASQTVNRGAGAVPSAEATYAVVTFSKRVKGY